MMNHKPIEGFSKLPKQGKIDWLVNEYLEGNQEYQNILKQYWNEDADLQKLHEEFSENTISNFYMPYGIAPNFLIDGKLLALPMAVEESSVVAAASKLQNSGLIKVVLKQPLSIPKNWGIPTLFLMLNLINYSFL
jgi:hydroxymethylglutaryl-CoA reductase